MLMMPYEEKYANVEFPHNLIIEGRSKLSVSGVIEVESFDEESVIISTSKGLLSIFGKGLHIEKLSLDTGDVIVEGLVDQVEYEDEVRASGGFFGRLFK
jgi:sporulation protein YabP